MDKEITAEELKAAIGGLKMKKAHYIDNVGNEQLSNGGNT